MKRILFFTALLLLISFGRDKIIHIYMIGDSTMAIKQNDKRPECGWGEKFQLFFNHQIIIHNHAKNGRSSKSFINENLWQPVLDSLKPGDYVFIQFGHNDESKSKGERYSTPDEFRNNLIKYVTETRSKKAIPVILTPVMRRRFDENGQFYDTHGEYPDITRQVAKDFKITLIDAHKLTEQLIKELGSEESKKIFLWGNPGELPNYPDGVQDNTHFCEYGAEKVAEMIANDLKKQNIKLAKYLMKNK